MQAKLFWIAAALAGTVLAQDSGSGQEATAASAESAEEKWDFFVHETAAPFILAAGAFNAAVSQATRSAPLYGRHWNAYPKRFGASAGDIASQNFFGDFVLASAFHEDTRYAREGASHGLWPRIGYAISRAVATRKDGGGETFNYANVLGTGMSAGLSNAYYPPASRTLHETMTNWGTSLAGSGLANLMPEFWQDFHGWVKRRLRRGP
ncbi:MAG TPA: hypothetical protein VKV74_16920 [Bryobacteraceae bacterium]|nr:hypothetical protein [Bryobacteraceae bacterium]